MNRQVPANEGVTAADLPESTSTDAVGGGGSGFAADGSPELERPMSPGRMHFPALDGCRALAAMGVLVTHVGLLSGYVTRTDDRAVSGPHGRRRVDLLRVVGIPVVPAAGGRPVRAQGLERRRRLARRRVLRIVPAYWVALTIVAFVLRAPAFFEPHSIVSHYLLLQIYDLDQLVGGPIQQSWSLATEVAFYVFVPCWAWLMSRRTHDPRSQLRFEVVALVALFLASTFGNLILVRIGVSDSIFAQLGTWLPFRIGDFVPGMLLAVGSAWVAHRGVRLPSWVTGAPLTMVCWAAAAAVFWFVSTQLDLPMFPTFTPGQAYTVRLLYCLFAALVVVPAVLARQDRGLTRVVFANPVAIWLGLISYGIYIWHEAWQDVYLRATDQQALNSSFVGMMVATLVATIISAAISWYLIERPTMRWGAKPRRRPASGVQPVAQRSR